MESPSTTATPRQEVPEAAQHKSLDCRFLLECDIAIELDGAPHSSQLGEEYEAERTRFLEAEGIVILRFENRILYQNIEAVLETIREAIRRRVADHPRHADHWRQHDNL